MVADSEAEIHGAHVHVQRNSFFMSCTGTSSTRSLLGVIETSQGKHPATSMRLLLRLVVLRVIIVPVQLGKEKSSFVEEQYLT